MLRVGAGEAHDAHSQSPAKARHKTWSSSRLPQLPGHKVLKSSPTSSQLTGLQGTKAGKKGKSPGFKESMHYFHVHTNPQSNCYHQSLPSPQHKQAPINVSGPHPSFLYLDKPVSVYCVYVHNNPTPFLSPPALYIVSHELGLLGSEPVTGL